MVAWSFPVRVLVFLSTTTGFCYQTWNISQDYFKYPTTTLVNLKNFMPFTIGPQVGIRITNPLLVGRPVQETFEAINKTIKTRGYMRTREWVRTFDGKILRSETFQLMEGFYIVVTPKEALEWTPDALYLKRRILYGVFITSQLFSNNQSLNIFIHPYDSDFEGLHKTDAKIDCHTFGKIQCAISITYTVKKTKLAPPPFDTACQDYNNIGFTSRENCLSECLTQFTEKHGFVIGSNVLKRDVYKNASLIVIPWYFKSFWTAEGHAISTDKLISLRTQYAKRNKTDYTTMLDRMIDIFPSYVNRWKYCKKTCQRPDCLTESNLPIVQLTKGMSNESLLKTVVIYFYPSNDLITIVTSQPKLNLLDFIVYILSCVNFWYGFCPLRVADMVTRRTRRKTKKHHIDCIIADIRQRLKNIEGD